MYQIRENVFQEEYLWEIKQILELGSGTGVGAMSVGIN